MKTIDDIIERRATIKHGNSVIALHKAVAEKVNTTDLPQINNKFPYQNADLTSPHSDVNYQYDKETKQTYLNRLREASGDQGTNANGTKTHQINTARNGIDWNVTTTNIAHDDASMITVRISKDVKGHTTSVQPLTPITHTDEIIKDVIEHHGVKGMKWGVRKDAGHEGERTKTSKIAKLDTKFEKQATNPTFQIMKIHNRAADLTNKNDVERINNKSEYKNKDFSKDSPLRQKYYAEHQRAYLNNVQKAADELGTNASGTKKYNIVEGLNGDWNVSTVDVSHDSTSPIIHVNVNYNSKGYITSVEPQTPITHDDISVDDVLSHHGIKGQRWGVRRSRGSDGTVKTGHVVSEDASKAAASKVIVKTHGTSALSNQDLQHLVSRMNLEQQFDKLSKSPSGITKIKKGHEAVRQILNAVDTAKKISALVPK